MSDPKPAPEPPDYSALSRAASRAHLLPSEEKTGELAVVGQILKQHKFRKICFSLFHVHGSSVVVQLCCRQKDPCFDRFYSLLAGDVISLRGVEDTRRREKGEFAIEVLDFTLTHRYRGETPWVGPADSLAGRPPGEVFCKEYKREIIQAGRLPDAFSRCRNPGCLYKHVPSENEKATLLSRIEERLKVTEQREKFLGPQADGSNENLETKRKRGKIFSDWLIKTFGLESLKKNGIVDIAGGKGILASHLAESGIKTWIVDPRVSEKNVKKYNRKRLEKSTASIVYMPSLFDESFWANPENLAILKSCGALVGLHPDQATDGILEFAASHEKSVAVLPCCVFPKQFPRKLKSGHPVRSYFEYCRWIEEQFPHLEKSELSMQGRNIVFFVRAAPS